MIAHAAGWLFIVRAPFLRQKFYLFGHNVKRCALASVLRLVGAGLDGAGDGDLSALG